MSGSNKAEIDQLLDAALAEHQAGRLEAAARLYDQALSLDPHHSDALNLRGLAAYEAGEHRAALKWIQQAIDIDPDAADFHFHLGLTHAALKLPAVALRDFQRVAQLEPQRSDVLPQLANSAEQCGQSAIALDAWKKLLSASPENVQLLLQAGSAAERLNDNAFAIQSYEAAVRLSPDLADTERRLIRLLGKSKHIERAIETSRQAVSRRPDAFVDLINLAMVLGGARQHQEAESVLRHARTVCTGDASAKHMLGSAYRANRKFDEAQTAFRESLAIDPARASVAEELSRLLIDVGDSPAALPFARQAVHHAPASSTAHCALGIALSDQGQPIEAAVAIERAVDLDPASVDGWQVLASICRRLGNYQRAGEAYDRALSLRPNRQLAGQRAVLAALRGDLSQTVQQLQSAINENAADAAMHSDLLLYLNGEPAATPLQLLEAHQLWAKRHAQQPRTPFADFPNDRNPDRPLRVGYVSADFRFHAVAFFITKILASHRRGNVLPFLYENLSTPDQWTRELRDLAYLSQSVHQLDDQGLVNLIRSDRIDVLVDLAGHTRGNRLGVFARRAAPIQVNYLGYPNTTGLATMDYRLTDAVADPFGEADSLHTETLARLNCPFVCYWPRFDIAAVEDLPAVHNGYVTFCSFNALTKLNFPLIEMWSAVLTALPTSRLVIKGNGLHELNGKQQLHDLFAKAGISSDRLILLPRAVSYLDHMATYSQCDIALDTFPYNGTTTTCESLWMGVPVVTRCGQTHASRVSASLLKSIGLDDWIAHGTDDFVKIATRAAADITRLASLRRDLRHRMQQSPLMDYPGKTREIESAYRAMWLKWLSEQPTETSG